MFEKVQQLTSTKCGERKGMVFDGYSNGDIIFTQVQRVGDTHTHTHTHMCVYVCAIAGVRSCLFPLVCTL